MWHAPPFNRSGPASAPLRPPLDGQTRFAQRLPHKLAAGEPRGLVQLDTVFVNLTPTKAIKHFTAYDPIAKSTAGKAFNRATAQAAASFLDKITADMLFPVKGHPGRRRKRVPGRVRGSRPGRGIALYVLPPRSPQMNGAVERCNGAWRYEFCETYDLPDRRQRTQPDIRKATSTSITTTGPMALLPEEPQPSIARTLQTRHLSGPI